MDAGFSDVDHEVGSERVGKLQLLERTAAGNLKKYCWGHADRNKKYGKGMRQEYMQINQEVVTIFQAGDDGDLPWDGTADRKKQQTARRSRIYF